MSNLILKADGFAAGAHAGQVRKYTGEPYVEHCRTVSVMVREFASGMLYAAEEVEAAALLHDTLEDTKVTLADLQREFGPCVASIVFELTEQRPAGWNRAQRKTLERKMLGTASKAAQTIKACDLIDNARSIIANDPKFAVTFVAEARAMLEALDRAHPILRDRLDEILSGFRP